MGPAAASSEISGRSPRVDTLRGFSILAVLLLHFSLSYDLVASPLSRVLPRWLLEAALLNGNYGVTVFFVISGFLITSNNLARYGELRDVRLRQFYAFRFARIIPPLLLALAIIVALGACDVPSFGNNDGGRALPPSFLWIAVASVLTFWHNVLMESVGYFNYCLNIYWSLSVEEVFYLGFPIACVLLKRQSLLIGLCALFIVAGPIYRASHRDDELFFEYGYLACFDAIALGCLVAIAYRSINVRRTIGRGTRVVAAGALAAAYLIGIDGNEVFGFSLVALSAAVLLTNAFERSRAGAAAAPLRALRWLGRHSYELYLFHIIVLAGLRTVVPKGALASTFKLPALLLFLLVSAGFAAAVASGLAEPVNCRLRSLLAGVRTSATP